MTSTQPRRWRLLVDSAVRVESVELWGKGRVVDRINLITALLALVGQIADVAPTGHVAPLHRRVLSGLPGDSQIRSLDPLMLTQLLDELCVIPCRDDRFQ